MNDTDTHAEDNADDAVVLYFEDRRYSGLLDEEV